MAKGSRGGRSRMSSRQYSRATASPYRLLRRFDEAGDMIPKKAASWLDKKEWEDVTCSVCMEFPHNAVLLLCSSHDKGCRPFMCGTSFRHSNCLDQYKKAYTKSTAAPDRTSGDELACPLCRGQVKGWTVVEPARAFLNSKCRSCVHDECSFVGTYKELRRHVRSDHPSRRPREVDPALEQKWRRLEREQERNDVISTITSTMPGAMFFGDYVIENGNGNGNAPNDVDSDSDDDDDNEGGFVAGVDRNPGFDSNLVNVFLLLHAFGPPGGDELNRRIHHHNTTPVGGSESSDHDDDEDDDVGGGAGEMSLGRRLQRHNGIMLGRAGRRRRRRDVNVNNVNVNGGGSR